MTKTWIIIADSAHARIFRPTTDRQKLKMVKDISHPRSRAHARELTTDRPGRTFESSDPGRHAMSESVSPKEHEADALCKELAAEIETGRIQGDFRRLFIAADPSFLGKIRKQLSRPTAHLLVDTLDKNLAHMGVPDIVNHLPDALLQE